jgi:hypothetical protein
VFGRGRRRVDRAAVWTSVTRSVSTVATITRKAASLSGHARVLRPRYFRQNLDLCSTLRGRAIDCILTRRLLTQNLPMNIDSPGVGGYIGRYVLNSTSHSAAPRKVV